jgi:hypothetical protein
MYCKHYQPDADGFVCEAFLKGIPDAIINNQTDHRLPVEGDQGIRFAAKGKAGTAYADSVFGARAV